MKNVRNISPINLSGTVSLFKELGKPAQAAELIKYYIENHGGDPKAFDLENFPFRENVTDPDVVSALNAKSASFKDERDPTETLLGVAAGWSEEDLVFLSELPVDEYHAIFKKSDATTLRKIINASLQFDRIGNATEPMREISKRAKEALRRIGRESQLNARRVAKYGVNVDDSTPVQAVDQTNEGS